MQVAHFEKRPDWDLLSQTEYDPGLGGIVWRHLHFHPVTHHQPNEALSHLSGNMGKHFVTARKGHFKHGSGKNSGNRALNLNGLLLVALIGVAGFVNPTTSSATASASASSKISWSSDNFIGINL